MTVKELIDKLKELPQEMEVVLWTYDEGSHCLVKVAPDPQVRELWDGSKQITLSF